MKFNFALIITVLVLISVSFSCDVVELVVYEKKVSVLREGAVSQSAQLSNTSEGSSMLDQQSLQERIAIPEGGKIDSVYISGVSLQATEEDDNEAANGRVSVYAKTNEGTEVLIVDNVNVEVGKVNEVQGDKLDLQMLKSLLNQLYIETETSEFTEIEFLFFVVEKPGQTIDWNLELNFEIEAKITYCSMVPGDSALPDCE